MSVYELLEQVKDRDSFLIFLESLAKDYDENHDELPEPKKKKK